AKRMRRQDGNEKTLEKERLETKETVTGNKKSAIETELEKRPQELSRRRLAEKEKELERHNGKKKKRTKEF
ncbi:hypothetical protein A2U01_0077432, partial [Trifolium medium]|nr:hypothetical protein [Trifolium medium]